MRYNFILARKMLWNNISQAKIKSHLRNVNIPDASWKLYFILFFVLAEIKTFELILISLI